MRNPRSVVAVVIFVVVTVVIVGYALYPAIVVSLIGPPDDYERTTVTAYGEDGDRLGRLDVRVADDRIARYAGLSYTENLSDDEGMWFVHDDTASRTFVMRGMSFDIDIVFVSADGTVTAIHHAEAPEEGADGEMLRYDGTGKYVLETPAHWTTRHGVTVGDCLDAAGYDTTCAS